MSTHCLGTLFNASKYCFKPKLLSKSSGKLLILALNFSSTMFRQGKFDFPKRFVGQEKSVWVEYIDLAIKYKPLNLGQGFPDYPGPEHVTKALADVALGSDSLLHQYTRGFGHPRLVKALSTLYSKVVGRQIDPMNEIIVTSGAYEALYSTIQGHIDKGDEAIIIEPFFDCYEPMVKGAEGVCRFIALKPSGDKTSNHSSADWILDPKELEGLFNEKTKMIIINTPHNPTGKVFTLKELEFIAELCKKWDVLCVSDEVYEWMVFKPNKHIRMGMSLYNNSQYLNEY
uniref:Putative kynurenine aminotransferase glutamine transaminase k n=1 Tax=Xenopsylla cheopis TaxID=163159 RepID=A0A6M2DW65_XENCH